jgi:hypothetical protein
MLAGCAWVWASWKEEMSYIINDSWCTGGGVAVDASALTAILVVPAAVLVSVVHVTVSSPLVTMMLLVGTSVCSQSQSRVG